MCPEGASCETNDFHISLNYYTSFTKTKKDDQASGAYIFRPKNPKSLKTKPYSKVKGKRAFVGTIVTVVQFLGSQSETAVRFYNRQSHSLNWDNVVEVENFLYGIKVKKSGKEVVMNVKTNIKNQKTFETDANGLEMQKRVVNYRQSWVL